MKLTLFRGRPGTGKTTQAHKFAQEQGLCVISKDLFYDTLAQSQSLSDAERNPLSYQLLFNFLEENKNNNSHVVIDFPFQKVQEITSFQERCNSLRIELDLVLVICSDHELWGKRLRARSDNPKPNQIITTLDGFRELYGTLEIEPLFGERVVDTATHE